MIICLPFPTIGGAAEEAHAGREAQGLQRPQPRPAPQPPAEAPGQAPRGGQAEGEWRPVAERLLLLE